MANGTAKDGIFKAAFEASNTTNVAILEQHEKVVEVQKQVLSSLRQEQASSKGTNVTSRKHAQESGRLVFALDDLLQSTKQQLRDAEQQSSNAISRLNAIATERLAADDYVLEALSTLATHVLAPKLSTSVSMSTAEGWCQTLASIREEEAKAHVEAVFHDQIVQDAEKATNGSGQNGHSAKAEDMVKLQEELQTLRDEIPSIVQIVIEHQIRDPLRRNLQSCENHEKQSRSERSEYVTSTLEHLIARLETMSDQAIELGSYSSVIYEFRPLISAIESEAKTKGEFPKGTPPSQIIRSNSRSKFLENKGATASAIPQVLRRLNSDWADMEDQAEIMEALDTATTEATAKLRAQYAAVEHTTLENLEKSLGGKRRDLQAIMQKIYANSEDDNIHLSDRETDAKLQELNMSVDEIATAFEKANLASRDLAMARSAAVKSKWLPGDEA